MSQMHEGDESVQTEPGQDECDGSGFFGLGTGNDGVNDPSCPGCIACGLGEHEGLEAAKAQAHTPAPEEATGAGFNFPSPYLT